MFNPNAGMRVDTSAVPYTGVLNAIIYQRPRPPLLPLPPLRAHSCQTPPSRPPILARTSAVFFVYLSDIRRFVGPRSPRVPWSVEWSLREFEQFSSARVFWITPLPPAHHRSDWILRITSRKWVYRVKSSSALLFVDSFLRWVIALMEIVGFYVVDI